MQIIYTAMIIGALALGVAIGVVLTITRHQEAEARRITDEEELVAVQELYAAWAALRRGSHAPTADDDDPCHRK